MKTVVGLFDDDRTANEVIDMLEDRGVDRDDIHGAGHGSQHAPSMDENFIDGLTDRGVPEEEARFYAEGVRRGGSLVLAEVSDDRAADAADVMNEGRPVNMQRRRVDWEERGYTDYDPNAGSYTEEEAQAERERYATGEEEASMPVVEEEVRVGKRSVQRGGVRLHSHVREQPVKEEVTVRDEEIEVEEHPADRDLTDAEADEAFQERDIEMTETDEEVVAEKEAHVTGEVTARKRARERTETVEDTVRKTEVDVEDVGRGEQRRSGAPAFADYDDDFRRHHEESHEGAYEDYEPAYRHGLAHANDKRYADYDYAEARPAMRRSYNEKHGEGSYDNVEDASRYAYRRPHQHPRP